MPSPAEVYETLQGAVRKRFGERVQVVYVDVDEAVPPDVEAMASRLFLENSWLPVVAIGDEIVCEGVLKLGDVKRALARHGVKEEGRS